MVDAGRYFLVLIVINDFFFLLYFNLSWKFMHRYYKLNLKHLKIRTRFISKIIKNYDFCNKKFVKNYAVLCLELNSY